VASSEIPESADSSITDLALTWHADEIVVALDDRRGNLPVRDLLDARLAGIDVLDLSEFLERETGKIRVDLLKPGWLVFSPGFRTGRFRSFAKRVLDVLASLSLIVLTTPLILVVAIAIKLEDGLAAPLLYLQTRVGRGGRPFRVMKFRSMSADAEADGKARWATVNDKRVTAIGRIMRQYRIDEIPQLFNILRGEMSLVGPRPERPEFVEELQQTIPFYSVRHTVKPGLTGWAQLKYTYGATEEDALEKLQYELYYLKNHSLVLDLLIILQTVEVVLWGKGAR
jgi:sugar transferase (PEP-CTERM system associated)